MFVYYDSNGNRATYIQSNEMFELLLDASDSYWMGKSGVARVEWESPDDRRTMLLVCVPREGFQLSYQLADGGWIVAVNDKVAGKMFQAVIGGKPFRVDGHEIIARQRASANVGHFLDSGLPAPDQSWERLGVSFDLTDLDRQTLKI